jgi:hypothetical protein
MGTPMAHRSERANQIRLPDRWTLVVAGTDVAWGAVLLFGGSACLAYQRMMGAVVPMPVWGGVLAAVGVVLLTPWRPVAAMLGTFVWVVSGLSAVLTVMVRTAEFDGMPIPLFTAALLHLLLTWDTDDEQG